VLFSAMLWPGVGELVLSTGTKGILGRVMEGGVHDPRNMPPALVDALWQCGSLPGHARAFVSLCRNWNTWIAARSSYSAIEMPVTLAYGDYDWSWPADREANVRALPAARPLSLERCGHFSCLEQPPRIARIVREEVSLLGAA
jgi:pimeloyl-ACP methyl ester carboxylesterase